MNQCQLCNRKSSNISKALGVCLACIRQRPKQALERAEEAHLRSRAEFDLPLKPPTGSNGIQCNLCVNECIIAENEVGYCGLRKNQNNRLIGASKVVAKLSWYHDPLPTNCVADPVCAGGTGAGYPEYAHCSGAETGYRNLAVFFQACSFNCLYCQNWHFKRRTMLEKSNTLNDLVSAVDARTSCICYFGGDPTPQLPFSLRASKLARDSNRSDILRICWETNGSMNPRLLDQMMDLAIGSGGCVKFDLKAWDDNLHLALTGVTNRRTFDNFSRAAKNFFLRPEPPVLIANTLLVPGYIDEIEVEGIARFIATLDPSIPYSLSAFHPQFYMSDLPMTPKYLAERCVRVARRAGLKNVIVGNVHLLS
jgi:pyruvate formate lyase activating enzyme